MRGRPRKNGKQEGWMLFRRAFALLGYEQARSRGEKHSVAVREAVATVKSFHPDMPISESEVKRMLAEWRPARGSISYQVSEAPEAQAQASIAEYKALGLPGTPTRVFNFGFGPRPKYPRHNVKSR